MAVYSGTIGAAIGAAISTPEPQTTYPEAKRQYEALVHMYKSTRHDSNDDASAPDISHFYRTLFRKVTKGMVLKQRHMLQHVCFAFKTKKRVVQFLEGPYSEGCVWREELRAFVEEFGRDSNFLEQSELQTPEWGLPSPPPTDDGPLLDKPYFVIPTLPLAIPADFYSSLACHTPLEYFNARNLLSYPAAYLIALTDEVKGGLFTSAPDFWKSKDAAHKHTEAYKKERKQWKALFRHLAGSQFRLVTREDGLVPHDGDGYTMLDLNLWIAKWAAERMVPGNFENGRGIRAEIRRREEECEKNVDVEDEECKVKMRPKPKPNYSASPTAKPTTVNPPDAKERSKAWKRRKAELVKQGMSNHELINAMLAWTRKQDRIKRNPKSKKKKKKRRIPGF